MATIISSFSTGVRDGIYGNPTVFTVPPVSDIEFQAAITNYSNTLSAYEQGGNAQRGPYYAAEENLIGLLDQQAAYVDSVALGNQNIIWLSGFKPTKGTASKRPAPEQLQDIKITRGASGTLYAECEKQAGIDAYCCILSVGVPLPSGIDINAAGQLPIGENAPSLPPEPDNPVPPVQPMSESQSAIIDFTKNRKKKFMGLTPGVTYYFTFFGINAAGVGEFSEQTSITCW